MSKISDFKSLLLINTGNILPTVISFSLLPYYLVSMGENYYLLSLGLLILNSLLIFESGISRITALNVQSIISENGNAYEIKSEISHGLITLVIICAFLTTVLAFFNEIFRFVTVFEYISLSIFLFLLCFGAMLRSLQEVKGNYYVLSVSKPIYVLALNLGVVLVIKNDDLSLSSLTHMAILAKFLEIIYLIFFFEEKITLKNISMERIVSNLKKTSANFVSNLLSSSFLLIDKKVVLLTLTTVNASIYMGVQDIILKYAVVLSSFTTLYLKDANCNIRKKTVFFWMTFFHLSVSIVGLIIFYKFNFHFGVIDKSAVPILIIFLIGIFFNIAASFEIIQLQSKGRYSYIMKIHVVEVILFVAALYLVSPYSTIIGISVIWSSRMLVDYLILNVINKRLS